MKKVFIVVFGIFSIMAIVSVLVFYYVVFPKKYSDYVEKFAQTYSLDAALVYAIIKAESDFETDAVSSAGAIGLMQIMPATASFIADELSIENYSSDMLFSAETNILFGCYYLNYLFSKFDDVNAVIASYNAGETTVSSWLSEDGTLSEENILYSETKNYLKKVKRYYKVYSSQ